MSFSLRIRRHRRVVGWSAFGLALLALAWSLDVYLPPDPRWTVQGKFSAERLIPDGTAFGYVNGVQPSAPLTLREMRTGDPIGSFFVQAGLIHSWRCSANRRVVAAVPVNGPLWVANVETGEEWQLQDEFHFTTMSLSPDGEYLAIESPRDGGRLVHARTGHRLHSWQTNTVFHRWSATGEHLTYQRANRADNRVDLCIWDVRRKMLAGTLENAEYLASTADRNTLFAQQKDRGSTRFDRVILWDLTAGQARGRIGTIAATKLRIALSADECTAALWSDDAGAGDLEFWDLQGMRRLAVAKLPLGTQSGVLAPDGRHFASFDGQNVVILDARTGEELWQHPAFNAQAQPPVFTADSQSLVVITKDGLFWRDPATGASQHTRLASNPIEVRWSEAWAENRGVAYETPGWGRTQQVGWLVQQLRKWLPAGWVPDEELYQVSVFDTRTGPSLLELYDGPVQSAVLTNDGNSLVTIHADDQGQMLRCWDVPARKPMRWVLGVPCAIAATVLMMRAAWRALCRRRKPAAVNESACSR
jgi:outer membrane protein assembly factor BamB